LLRNIKFRPRSFERRAKSFISITRENGTLKITDLRQYKGKLNLLQTFLRQCTKTVVSLHVLFRIVTILENDKYLK